MLFLLVFFGSNCSSQDKNRQAGLVDRQPAVAGQFYPANPGQLKKDLADLFAKAQPKQTENVLAVISPHAGYVFSGQVAASSFNQIDTTKKYENIFILASSHRMTFDGASIYDKGNYKTPLGTVNVNLQLAKELLKKYPVFNDNTEAHIYEHSLEVQLPFLQYKLGNDFRIIPIIVGTQASGTCKKIGEALKPYLNENNLFVVSTDFSHYPDYEDAVEVDHVTAEAITANDPAHLLDVLNANEKKGYYNLATSLCGWTSVLSLLYMTEGQKDIEYKAVFYMNSGDAELYGDKERVVGYYSIVALKKQPEKSTGFSFNEEEKRQMLTIARSTINEYIRYNRIPTVDVKSLSPRLQEKYGAFVTLKEAGALRGCIGRFDPTDPLWEIIQNMAISSSTQDYRFQPVTADEIDQLEIEISVLSPLRPIKSIDEFELGKHGIYMKKGYNTGTFLPQVANETGWTKEEFLGHCARDKARIGWDGWKDAELFIYEAYVFSESEVK